MAEKLMTIPLSNLRRSTANIRKTDASHDLEELVASIAAHGFPKRSARLMDRSPTPRKSGAASRTFHFIPGPSLAPVFRFDILAAVARRWRGRKRS